MNSEINTYFEILNKEIEARNLFNTTETLNTLKQIINKILSCELAKFKEEYEQNKTALINEHEKLINKLLKEKEDEINLLFKNTHTEKEELHKIIDKLKNEIIINEENYTKNTEKLKRELTEYYDEVTKHNIEKEAENKKYDSVKSALRDDFISLEKLTHNADKQKKEIFFNDIRKVLQKELPEKFRQILLIDTQPIYRINYHYIKFKYTLAEREHLKLRFPLYDVLISDFSLISGGTEKHGKKKVIDTNTLEKIKKHNINENNCKDVDQEIFTFPFNVDNAVISIKQPTYYLPEDTYDVICKECNGEKYITCPECNGQHEWDCPNCKSSGKVKCNICNGNKEIICPNCKGTNKIKCKTCGGKGNISCPDCRYTSSDEYCKTCGNTRSLKCPDCKNGFNVCPICSKEGMVKCSECNGSGKIDCEECSGTGKIQCKVCSNNVSFYGKIICPTCEKTGKIGQIFYVTTSVKEDTLEYLFQIDGSNLKKVKNNQILKHCNRNSDTNTYYYNVNSVKIEDNNDYNRKFGKIIESELNLSKTGYPKLLKEEIYYQVVPYIKITYKHIFTNLDYNMFILNIFDNPEIVFESEPMLLKSGMSSLVNAFSRIYHRIFNTKRRKENKDIIKEIKLLIYLARADMEITKEEKTILVREIQPNLKYFSNSVRKLILGLLEQEKLPELTYKDISFYSSKRKNNILSKLEEIAKSDNDFSQPEKILINKIKELMK